MTRVLLSVGTFAGLPSSDWCRVIAAPGAMPLHGGSAAAPGAPAAPVAVHLLCVGAQLEKKHRHRDENQAGKSNSRTQQLSPGAASALLRYLK